MNLIDTLNGGFVAYRNTQLQPTSRQQPPVSSPSKSSFDEEEAPNCFRMEKDIYKNDEYLNLNWEDVLSTDVARDLRTSDEYINYMNLNIISLKTASGVDIFIPNTESNAKREVFGIGAASASRERENFNENKLDPRQKVIFDRVISDMNNYDNKNKNGKILLIQAAPGTGKSYTLKTISHTLMRDGENLPHVIIFKNSLISSYKYCAAGLTCAQFFMYSLNLKFRQYASLDKITNRMNSVECVINNILQIVRIFKTHRDQKMNLVGNILMFDEYTVMNKLLLYATLLCGKLHKLNMIFCGDRDQLGCILTSKHSKNTSSYDIIKSFSNYNYTLNKQMRCVDDDFNKKIALVGGMSTDESLGHRGNAITAAIFINNLTKPNHLNDTLIMRNHKTLSHYTYINVLKYNLPTSHWLIEGRRGEVQGVEVDENRYMPKPTYMYLTALYRSNNRNNQSADDLKITEAMFAENVPGKYLPFLVLISEAIYYYKIINDS
ncbi:uncharacterized protein LOC112595706, partial [Melanaphis sacchari]|uniref:uncharacterized protein LOC112595706 n=1 Tax=Melanaphis sacchari TaxID=742174 RepID=UPI000DC12EF1